MMFDVIGFLCLVVFGVILMECISLDCVGVVWYCEWVI